MAITRHNKHNKCNVVAIRVISDTNPHYAKLCCKKHKTMIQWLNKETFESIVQEYPDTIGQDGVKERPTRRQKPKKRLLLEQRKDGHLWRTVY